MAPRDKPLPPGPRGLPLIGSALETRRDILGLLQRGMLEYGDTVRFRFGPWDFVTLHRPEDIRAVLLERHADFRKSPSYEGLKLILGTGLLTSEGEFWQRQRKLATPAFHHKRLVGFAETMTRCTSELGEVWAAREHAGDATIDVFEQMTALTFRIVGLTLFSTELSDHAGAMGPALAVAVEHANYLATSLMLAAPPWLPTRRNRRFRAAVQVIDDLVLGIIAERRRSGEHHPDLLGMLMAATVEGDPSAGMSDAELRDEVATLVLAGHETTANALTWTLVLLAQHPEIDARVHEEIERVCGSAPPSFEQLAALPYVGQVIDESMRLYPPAWMFERQAIADVELGDYAIPRGTLVAISPWTLHRHPGHWPRPLHFDPDRFDEAAKAARPRYTYLPFGGGPRQCIGTNFALIEAKLVLATLLQRFRLELLPGQDLRPDPAVTLRPRQGLQMRLHPRA
ncbi:cytochrome P450 [Nannocystaceae bacterium ST9]